MHHAMKRVRIIVAKYDQVRSAFELALVIFKGHVDSIRQLGQPGLLRSCSGGRRQ